VELKAAEPERAHVAAVISRARCDLDLTTDKRGRPYDRRARQRKQDLEDLAWIDP
jgi:hypothetical protein